MHEDILESLKQVIAEYQDVEPEEIDEDMTFAELDIDIAEEGRLIEKIEEEFDIELTEEELLDVDTFGDLQEIIEKIQD